MTIYHGGYQAIETPRIIKGEFAKDFGCGFYCTEIKEQAERWSKRYPTPIVSIYDYQENSSLKTLHFKEMTEEWLDFIIACRSGQQHDYDIVIGAMADDQIYNYISALMSHEITREAFWELAKFNHPTHQIVFCTENALKCIKFIGAEEIENGTTKK